jgi:hypothetical protein
MPNGVRPVAFVRVGLMTVHDSSMYSSLARRGSAKRISQLSMV